MSIYVSCTNPHTGYIDAEIAAIIAENIDLTPAGINKRLKLRAPIYESTASYGHFGRLPNTIVKDGQINEIFTWEKLDLVDKFKDLFNL